MRRASTYCELAIVGGGIVGLFAMYWARKQGANVMVFDRYYPPHHWGSSHGGTRAIEHSFNEIDERYKPWVPKTWHLWEMINQAFPSVIPLRRTGAIILLAERDSRRESIQSWGEELGVSLTVLGTRRLRSYFPDFSIPHHTVGIWEKDAGLIRVEPLIEAMVSWAETSGVSQHFDEEVQEIRMETNKVTLITSQRNYHAKHVIVTPGSGLSQFDSALPISTKRQIMFWVPANSLKLSAAVSVDVDGYSRIAFYPHGHKGVKIVADEPLPENPFGTPNVRWVSAEMIARVNHAVRPFWRGIDRAPLMRHERCTDSYTPDSHFYVGIWPKCPPVVIGAGFSGRGFKYAPLVGQWLVDLALQGNSDEDLSLFRLNRYS